MVSGAKSTDGTDHWLASPLRAFALLSCYVSAASIAERLLLGWLPPLVRKSHWPRWLIFGSKPWWGEPPTKRGNTCPESASFRLGASTRSVHEPPRGSQVADACGFRFILVRTPPLRLQEAAVPLPGAPPNLCGQHSAPAAPPHTRYDNFWRSGAATPLGRPAAPPGAIRNGES